MQIMDGHDVRDILQMRTYFVEIQSVRGLLQQHFQRIAQQLHRTWNHQQRDQAAGDGIEAIPPGEHHDHGRRYDRHRAQGIIHHFEERGFHVHVVVMLPGKDDDRADIGSQTQNAEEQQQPTVRHMFGGSSEQSHPRLDQRIQSDEQQDHRSRLRGQHLKPGPTPGAGAVGLSTHKHRRHRRCNQHRHVREHMPGIHQQCQ